tara:strand:- start:1195 stop:1425 length:231 start_codon:yes stop_codon:yes gene_type:complete
MKTVKINIYKFEELPSDIQEKIVIRFDEDLGHVGSYEEDGLISYQSHCEIYQQDKGWIVELCEMNDYWFYRDGELY